jgi:hypothetical protein
MATIIQLIPDSFFDQIQKDLGTSTVVALQRLGKIVSGKTARSVRTEMKRNPTAVDIAVIAGEGMKYIVEGKEANTKYPVEKKGDKFELVQPLKDWKAIVNFQASDFILARSIATKKRDPVDVAGETLKVYQELFGKKTNDSIINFTVADIRNRIKKIK